MTDDASRMLSCVISASNTFLNKCDERSRVVQHQIGIRPDGLLECSFSHIRCFKFFIDRWYWLCTHKPFTVTFQKNIRCKFVRFKSLPPKGRLIRDRSNRDIAQRFYTACPSCQKSCGGAHRDSQKIKTALSSKSRVPRR